MKLGSKKTMARNRSSKNTGQAYPNRAEEVRSRRAQRSKERVSSASSRAASPFPRRPVVVRGGAYGRPIIQQAARSGARRQFYVTMDRAAGTELRLPAIPALHLGWRLVSSLLAIAMAFGIFSMWNSDYCRINTVEVKGLQRLNADTINASLNLENLSIIEVDPGQVKEKLASTYPELMNIRVRVEMPNAVSISAEERVPVLAIVKGDQTEWADASGYIFPVRGETGPLEIINTNDGLPLVPILTDDKKDSQQDTAGQEAIVGDTTSTSAAEAAPRIVDPTVLTALQELSKLLPPETQLAYNKEHGLGWKAPEGWQVYIGSDLHQFEEKYNMYQQLTSYLSAEEVTPELVSVEHLNAPYYRLEQ